MKKLLLLCFVLVGSAFAGEVVDPPKPPSDTFAVGSTVGACYGEPAILKVWYDTNRNGFWELALYFDKDAKVLVGIVYEDKEDGDALYAIAQVSPGKYEKMSFSELVTRFPSPCDLLLKTA